MVAIMIIPFVLLILSDYGFLLPDYDFGRRRVCAAVTSNSWECSTSAMPSSLLHCGLQAPVYAFSGLPFRHNL
jgi:hypothetical protein